MALYSSWPDSLARQSARHSPGQEEYTASHYANGVGTVQIVNSTLTGNSAGNLGGAICNEESGGNASLHIVSSTMTANSAGYGGAIYNDGSFHNASVQIINSTLSGNSAFFYFGCIFNKGASSGSGSVQIVNSTLSGNSGVSGSAIYNLEESGGNASLQMLNSTLSEHSGFSGIAIINAAAPGSSASLEIGSTILNAGSSGQTIHNDASTVTSLGYNLSSDAAGGFLTGTADQINTDPMLGPLQDNGGPTFTHALSPCSPAIDQGKNFSASATDQRGAGFTRSFDGLGVVDATGGDGTDIGAFELTDTSPPTITCPDIVANATSPAGSVVNFVPCSLASVSCNPASGSTFAIGATIVSCEAVDGAGLTASCSFTVYVKGAAEQINDLIAYVEGLAIDSGLKTGLLVKLQDALSGANANNQRKACAKLQDFINLCNAQLAKSQLTSEEADYLINEATRIRAVIGC